MPCNIVRFKDHTNHVHWGVYEDAIYPLEGAYASTAELLNSGRDQAFAMQANLQAFSDRKINPRSVELLSPVTNPCQVLCQGANYRQHMIESGMNPDAKTFNMLFNKSAACINSPNGDIVRPAHVKLLDYEIELGLVIGQQLKQAKEISEQHLADYIAGIVIGNDISARDVQIPQMQFFKGKSYRSFCPVGPYLCLLREDEYDYLHKLQLTLKVNGEIRQSDNTSELVFKPAETLSELSQVADLNVGDLVLTGTPAGCALRAPKPFMVRLLGLIPEHKKWHMFINKQSKRAEYLQPGDTIEATIKSNDGVIDLGVQKNAIVG